MKSVKSLSTRAWHHTQTCIDFKTERGRRRRGWKAREGERARERERERELVGIARVAEGTQSYVAIHETGERESVCVCERER